MIILLSDLPSVTLIFNLSEQMFQMALLLLKDNKCAKFFCNGSDKLNLWPFYCLTFKCDLDLQLTWTNVSNGTSTPQVEQLWQILSKCSHKCRSDGSNKLNLWPFYCLTFKCDLGLQVIDLTSSIYDHFIIWCLSLALTFKLHFYSSRTTTVPNYLHKRAMMALVCSPEYHENPEYSSYLTLA